MVIYSEGAVSWTEAWCMSALERDLFIKTLNTYNAQKSGKSNNEML